MTHQRKLCFIRRWFLLLCCLIILIPLNLSAANLTFSKNVKDNEARNLTQKVQLMLIEIGYDPGLPDGFTGLRTEAALRSFQRDHKLNTNGKMGPATIKALKKAYVSDN